MNILDEITIDFDLDSKILCNTPAKLKLREKTLKGIRFNLDDEDSTIPALMLAKKNKQNNENDNEVIQEELVEETKEYTGKPSFDLAEASPEIEMTRKLRVSFENGEVLKGIGQEIMNTIRDAANINLGEVPVVEDVKVEEIPEVGDVIEPIIEVPTEEIAIEETQIEEEPQYNVEQGEKGVVATIEPISVPTIDEVREKIIPTVMEEQSNNLTALDRANTDDVFRETTVLKQEIDELKEREQQNLVLLNKRREDYQNEVNIGTELDKTYAERHQQARELEQKFYDAVEQQKSLLRDMKQGVEERNRTNEQEIQEFTNKTAAVKEENAIKLEKIQEEDNKIVQFKNLIQSVQTLEGNNNYGNSNIVQFPGVNQSVENTETYEEETAYRKVV